MATDGQRLVDASDGRVLCESCAVADKPLLRMRGLLGRPGLPPGEGLLILPAPAVHTLFMRFPIDAVFVDRELRIVGISEHVRPWRATGRRGAHAVLELAAGEAARLDLAIGDRLALAPRIEERGDARVAA